MERTRIIKKRGIRYAIYVVILVLTAVGGRWWARRTAAGALRPHIIGLIELRDVEAVTLLLETGSVDFEEEWGTLLFYPKLHMPYTENETPLLPRYA